MGAGWGARGEENYVGGGTRGREMLRIGRKTTDENRVYLETGLKRGKGDEGERLRGERTGETKQDHQLPEDINKTLRGEEIIDKTFWEILIFSLDEANES